MDHPTGQSARTFSLTALNTWSRELGATYFGPRQVQTRIDFILVQQRDGDSMAKRVTYGGHSRDHVPLLGGIQWRRFYTPKNDSGLTKNQRATLYITEEWTTMISTVASQLRHCSPDHIDLEALNAKMMQVCRQFRPTMPGILAIEMQSLTAAPLPDGITYGLLGIFQQWRWVIRLTKWRKQARRTAVQHRRNRLQYTLLTQ